MVRFVDKEYDEQQEGGGAEIKPDRDGLEQLFVTAPELDAIFEVNGNCPVQGFGTALGRELYFRARHDGWSFDVADHTGRVLLDGSSNSDGFYREADHPNVGWMPLREAVQIIATCVREYTGIR